MMAKICVKHLKKLCVSICEGKQEKTLSIKQGSKLMVIETGREVQGYVFTLVSLLLCKRKCPQ